MPTYEVLDDIVKRANQSEKLREQLKGDSRVVQFDVDGGKFVLQIREDGSMRLERGSSESPTVTLTASGDVMDGILAGKMNGVQAFITGKLKLSGNIMAAQKLVSALEKARQ